MYKHAQFVQKSTAWRCLTIILKRYHLMSSQWHLEGCSGGCESAPWTPANSPSNNSSSYKLNESNAATGLPLLHSPISSQL